MRHELHVAHQKYFGQLNISSSAVTREEKPAALFNEYGEEYDRCFLTIYGGGCEEGFANANLVKQYTLKQKKILLIRDIGTGSRLHKDRFESFKVASEKVHDCTIVGVLDIDEYPDNNCSHSTIMSAIFARENSNYINTRCHGNRIYKDGYYITDYETCLIE